MSFSEKILWEWVRKDRLGVRFRTQVAIGKWFLDFYCPEALLNVEIDGEQHELRREKDEARDAFLANKGIKTHRIPSLQMHDGASQLKAMKELCRVLSERLGREIKLKRN